jgi:hypothetical protein
MDDAEMGDPSAGFSFRKGTCDWHAGLEDPSVRWQMKDWRKLAKETQKDLPSMEEIDQYCFGEKDFVISCKLGGKPCEEAYEGGEAVYATFVERTDTKHCRCQTFSANPNFIMKRTGVRPGSKLELILNVHSNEFWPTTGESEGVRVSIHERNTIPDPTQGFVVGKSTHAEIAMTVKTINRLDYKLPSHKGWGNCNDDKEGTIPRYFSGMTLEECSNVRLAEEIVERCGCYDAYLDPYFTVRTVHDEPDVSPNPKITIDPSDSPASPLNRESIPACSSANVPSRPGKGITDETQNTCRFTMHTTFLDNFDAKEKCIVPCKEVKYDYRMSQVAWPVGVASDITKELVVKAITNGQSSIDDMFGRLECLTDQVYGSLLGRNLHSRMPLVPTPARLK